MSHLILLPIALIMAASDSHTGFALSRTVPPGASLIHTNQLFPSKSGTIHEQVANVVDQAKELAGGAEGFVRLHAVISPEVKRSDAIDALKAAFPDEASRPALTLVRGTLEKPGALIAIDVVAVGEKATEGRSRVLPAGGRIDIAGQAEKADDTLPAATKATLESLERTLKFLGSDRSKIVLLKGFFEPASDAAVVRKAVAEYFAPEPAPPLVLVEWTMSLPIEIELVAATGPETPAGLQYLTPPGMTASPVYSRTAVTQGNFETIYTSGLTAPDGTAGPDQAKPIYERLKEILDSTGSDMQHLTKATYYVTKDEANKSLDALRPSLYDPKRPPTASKSGAIGLIHDGGQGLLVDMIAVKIVKP